MHYFEYRSGELHAEGVPVRRIAEEVGTPTYVYSLATLRRHYQIFDQAFARLPHLVCFSVKANSNLAVLRVFVRAGGGFDIVSGGEIFRAQSGSRSEENRFFRGREADGRDGRRSEGWDFDVQRRVATGAASPQ